MIRYTTYLTTLLMTCALLVSCASEIDQPTTSTETDSSSQAEPTTFCTETDVPATMPTASSEEMPDTNPTQLLSSVQDVGLYEVEGQEQTYAFLYDGETYQAIYTPDNWKIIDSYRITNAEDIEIICQALADVHPIHGADMESYRTAEDMAYEWIQHNLAYRLLPDNSAWKLSAKDVDINPEDQGKSVYDFYRERIGDAEQKQNP